MKKKLPLSYREIQRIKLEEFERFFARLPHYQLHMNHLGEVLWLSEQEAEGQHEFFLYEEPFSRKWLRKWRLRRTIRLKRLSPAERELRLRFRKYLEERYLGEVQPETAAHLPEQWEFDVQEEDLLNIPIILNPGLTRRGKVLAAVAVVLLFLGLLGGLWYYFQHQEPQGKLLVETNVPVARVYLDKDKFVGYSNRVINKIPPGQYHLTVTKQGYEATPTDTVIRILADSLTVVRFALNIKRSHIQGYLKITAPEPHSRIYINRKLQGMLSENPVIVLDGGTYTVRVEKSGFVTLPPEENVTITPGDTTYLVLQQIPLSEGRRPARTQSGVELGSIEVASNVKHARILLNGKDSGHQTDYIFAQMPLGRYKIEVRKEGYESIPAFREVILTRDDPSISVRFVMRKKGELVQVVTEPPGGKIYVDGKFMGTGRLEEQLPIGEHTISFGAIPGYNPPRKRVINLREGRPIKIEVRYFPRTEILGGVDRYGNIIEENCNVETGYLMPGRAFTASSKNGPEIVFSKELNDYLWKLGFAFPYRNPKGNDAVKMEFKLPRELGYEQKFVLKIYAIASDDRYPLTISPRVDISIKFNNHILSYYYEPESIKEVKSLEEAEWDITPYVKPGLNVLEIATTDKNNVYYFLKKMVINNIPAMD